MVGDDGSAEGQKVVTTIRIRTRIEGEALVLPELKPLIGKTVDIEVTERADETSPDERWAAAAESVKEITNYDFDAWSEQRALDAARGGDHLQ